MIAPLGENVNGFERELAEKVGSKEAAALSSGTAAIHLALKAAGVGREILFSAKHLHSQLLPTLSFIKMLLLFS